MTILYLIIFFIFGSLMGSFLTVIGLRLPKNENFTTTHSHCDSCGHILYLYEMIPIVSYLIHKGRCRYCKAKIDSLSTFVELFTGLLFALAFYAFGFSYQLVIAIGIVCLLMSVVVSDITYLIIPDELLVFFSLYFIIFQLLDIGLIETIKHLLSGIFLFGLMYIIMLIGNKTLKKESLGGGDIKMMFVFGLVLDPLLGTLSVFIASLVALPVSLILLKKQNERMIPFGPFLLIALTFIYFSGITSNTIIEWLNMPRL